MKKIIIVAVILLVLAPMVFLLMSVLERLPAPRLRAAIKAGATETVAEIIQQNPELITVTNIGDTPLHLASMLGRDSIVALLLESGSFVDPHAEQRGSMTPLLKAAFEGHHSTVKLLLSHGANPNFHGGGGNFTALHTAAVHGRLGMVRTLIQYGADPASRDDLNRTPLVEARERGYTKIVAELNAIEHKLLERDITPTNGPSTQNND